MPSKRSAAVPAPASEPLEFRSPSDDAWYAVRLRMEGNEILRVMYVEFSEVYDERFGADRFNGSEEVEEFRGRFRPTSVQLQDWECGNVIEGMEVCAFHTFKERDLRYYDAVVDAVNYSTHSLVGGKDECSCTFVVLWQQGQLAGEKTSIGIANMCLIQPKGSGIDPILEHFLDMARKKLEARKSQVGPFPESSRQKLESPICDIDPSNVKIATCSGGNLGSPVDYHSQRPKFSSCNREEMITPKRIVGNRRKLGQDIDLGSSKKGKNYATESYYFFRIENLEKDVSPFFVMDFILEQTSISSQAFICPGYSLESYSTGTILVETKEKADKLCNFLFNPGHIIMSSRGRPWVMNKKWSGSVEGVMPFYEKQQWNKNADHSSKINLVKMGTKEYERGEHLLKIHQEFHDHAQLLQRRLARAERELMQ